MICWKIRCRLRALALVVMVLSWQLDHVQAGDEHCDGGRLSNWIVSSGGKVHALVGHTHSGLRGLIAARKLRKGNVICSVPMALCLNLGPDSVTAAEGALKLVRQLYHRSSRFDPYLTCLPREDELLTLDMFSEEAMAMLQSKGLVEVTRERQRHTSAVYHGEVPGVPTPSALTRGTKMTLEEFQRAVALVTSRSLAFNLSDGSNVKLLVPLIDMANHQHGSAHSVSIRNTDKGTLIELIAGATIHKGQEVTISYGNLRPDDTALYYGFVPPDDPPPVLSVDLEHWTPLVRPGATQQHTDITVTGSRYDVAFEINRLSTIAEELPTTLDQDRNKYNEATDKVSKLLLWLRIARKKALAAEGARLMAFLEEL